VTCAGIMVLVQDGALDLDTDINKYLPFEVHIPKTPNVPITMRMLLTHTSAIRDRDNVWGTPWSTPSLYFHGDSPISLGSFCRSYFAPDGSRYERNGNFYERAPGTRYAYSNLAVALAGFVAESVSGTDFDAWCRRRILRPLGMTDSGYRLADIHASNIAMPYTASPRGFEPIFQYGYPDYPDGALRTSAAHLARWLGSFMNFGSFQGARVLDEDTVKEIRRNQVPDVVSWLQGLIWYGDTSWGFLTLGHTGGDFGESTRMFLPAGSAGRRGDADQFVSQPPELASVQQHRGAALRGVRVMSRASSVRFELMQRGFAVLLPRRSEIPAPARLRRSGAPPRSGSRTSSCWLIRTLAEAA
jgi:CubicO group peptidase (beta-lactamase class C family)